MKKKVLIATNPLDHEGGVVNYYRIFIKNFDSEEIELIHHPFGSRMNLFYSLWKKRFLYPFYFCNDYFRLFFRLIADPQICIIQINPSLIPIPLIRDGLILLLARLLGRKTIVFYRGWKENVVDYLKSKHIAQWLFRFVYGRADLTLVLCSSFKDDLITLGWFPPMIHVTKTMYESKLIQPPSNRTGKRPRFLFLGRISKLKGVGEIIEAARLLDERGYHFECLLVGHEEREGIVEDYSKWVEEYGLAKHFHFTGRLNDKEKFQAYSDSDIYIFPSWTEGCPTSVLEALGSGLFVISTDVGALSEIIEDGKNGRIVRLKNYYDLSKKMIWASENIENIRKRRKTIQEDALARYEVSIIVEQFKDIYHSLAN